MQKEQKEMKFSTIMAVLTVAFAVATSGCRYSKAGAEGGDGAALKNDTAGVSDLASEIDDVESARQSGSLDAIAEGGRFEDLYTRCTSIPSTSASTPRSCPRASSARSTPSPST